MNTDTTPSATGAPALPPFLGRYTDGTLYLVPKLATLDNIAAAVKALPAAQKAAFGEALLDKLGYNDDYYTGWQLTPGVVAEILAANPSDMVDAYLEASGLFQQVDWKWELICKARERSNHETR